MDKELFEKFKLGKSPFDGDTLFTSSRVELEELRILIIDVISFICNKELLSDNIYKGWDWFEHDGYMHAKELVSKEFLDNFTSSLNDFYKHRAGDSYVKLGLLDEEFRWYLRIFIEDEYEIGEDGILDGTMDISGSEEFIKSLIQHLSNSRNQTLFIESSKEFFDKRYAGTI